MWVLENGSIRFVQLRYDDEDDEQSLSSRILFGFMHKEMKVKAISPGKLTLECEDKWESEGTEHTTTITHYFEKVE